MEKNVNVGFLGHVDSGKTSLVKALSTTLSTASLDKHPESQARGITIDLGFSSYENEGQRFTLVDCPGHASLLKTIICGVQIIDEIILVIDCLKGIQNQTVECLVLAELILKPDQVLIVALNKVDLVSDEGKLKKLKENLSTVLNKTKVKNRFKIIEVSVVSQQGIERLKQNLLENSRKRNLSVEILRNERFYMNVDHCFEIKGKGIVLTGTILEGKVAIGDEIEIPKLHQIRKVKSIQIFHKNVEYGVKGNRAALLITNISASAIERSLITTPNMTKSVKSIVSSNFQRIKYYKKLLKSHMKVHVHICNQIAVAKLIFFKIPKNTDFKLPGKFEFLETIEKGKEFLKDKKIGYILEFEKQVLIPRFTDFQCNLIGLDLMTDQANTVNRICFASTLDSSSVLAKEMVEIESVLTLYRRKLKKCRIDRIVDTNHVIIKELFNKNIEPERVIGLKLFLEENKDISGEIISRFGKTGKYKAYFSSGTENLVKGNELCCWIEKSNFGL